MLVDVTTVTVVTTVTLLLLIRSTPTVTVMVDLVVAICNRISHKNPPTVCLSDARREKYMSPPLFSLSLSLLSLLSLLSESVYCFRSFKTLFRRNRMLLNVQQLRPIILWEVHSGRRHGAGPCLPRPLPFSVVKAFVDTRGNVTTPVEISLTTWHHLRFFRLKAHSHRRLDV